MASLITPTAWLDSMDSAPINTVGKLFIAEDSSAVVKAVMAELQDAGVSRLYPGCDLITIKEGNIDRLIELKSSTVDARVQDMSWNEWKTARESSLRERFYLYLAGNLRSDLQDAAPFLLALKDPVGSLFATDRQGQQRSRRVQLNVQEFEEAERLVLTVRPVDEGRMS